MMPRVVVRIDRSPAGQGRPVYLVGDDLVARDMCRRGDTALGPTLTQTLATIADVFPGARVEALNRQRSTTPTPTNSGDPATEIA